MRVLTGYWQSEPFSEVLTWVPSADPSPLVDYPLETEPLECPHFEDMGAQTAFSRVHARTHFFLFFPVSLFLRFYNIILLCARGFSAGLRAVGRLAVAADLPRGARLGAERWSTAATISPHRGTT